MTDLVTFIGNSSAENQHVIKVIENGNWENVFILVMDVNKINVLEGDNLETINIDSTKMLSQLIDDIIVKLKGKIKIMECAVNIICGSGMEHMALLSALLKLGAGIRFVAYTREGIKEI